MRAQKQAPTYKLCWRALCILLLFFATMKLLDPFFCRRRLCVCALSLYRSTGQPLVGMASERNERALDLACHGKLAATPRRPRPHPPPARSDRWSCIIQAGRNLFDGPTDVRRCRHLQKSPLGRLRQKRAPEPNKFTPTWGTAVKQWGALIGRVICAAGTSCLEIFHCRQVSWKRQATCVARSG